MKISVMRALAELKMLDKRITAALVDARFVGIVKGSAKQPADHRYGTLESLEKAITSSFDSVEGLIRRQQNIRSAVTQSNATTKVTIAKNEMTVAEALAFKDVLEAKKKFLKVLKDQTTTATVGASQLTNQMEALIQSQQNSLYGNDAKNIDEAQIKIVRDQMEQQHKPYIVTKNGVDLPGLINSLEKEISEFETTMDFVLNESNASTQIEIAD